MKEVAVEGDDEPDDVDMQEQEVELTEEEIANQIKIKELKMAEAAKIAAYEEKLKSTTRETFQDRPDEVCNIFIEKSMDTSVTISWEEPCNNNIPISSYKVYLGIHRALDAKSEAKIHWEHKLTVDSLSDDPFFEGKIESRCTVSGLEPCSCYYLKVTAVNENGEEGYHSKEPFFVQTMGKKITNCDSLYVWGYNARNELGLPDNVIDENQTEYVDQAMTKPTANPMFNGFTYQVAPGNVSTLFLCANRDTKDTFLVTCGMCFAPNEGYDDQDVDELTAEEV